MRPVLNPYNFRGLEKRDWEWNCPSRTKSEADEEQPVKPCYRFLDVPSPQRGWTGLKRESNSPGLLSFVTGLAPGHNHDR
jgi:hypothetical protein